MNTDELPLQAGGTIFVTGATGYVGGRLVPALLEAGYRVRCLVREPRKLDARPWRQHARWRWSPAIWTTPGPGRGYGRLPGGLLSRPLDGGHRRHLCRSRPGTRRELCPGRADGRRRVGSSTSAAWARWAPISASTCVRGGRWRRNWPRPASPVTTFRAAMIIGSGSASFEILRYLVERLPIMVTPKWVDDRMPAGGDRRCAALAGPLPRGAGDRRQDPGDRRARRAALPRLDAGDGRGTRPRRGGSSCRCRC